MIIRELNEEFEVIYIREMWQGYQIIQCRTVDRQENFIMLRFIKEDDVKKLLPLFFILRENTVYEDYKGCFTRAEGLYVVFYKRQGTPLTELLGRQVFTLEQRLAIGKRILEKVLLWKLPDFLIGQMLNVEYILLEGEEVAFDYEWYIFYGEQSGMDMINKRVTGLLKSLFAEEIEQQISPGLMELLESLEQNVPKDFFAIYEAYSTVCDVVSKEAEVFIPGIQRMKMRILPYFHKGLEVLKILLFVAAYIMGIWLLEKEGQEQKLKVPEEKGVIYESIGNVKIKK